MTIMGVERTLFFTSIGVALGFFEMFNNLFVAIGLFVVLVALAKMATKNDPKMLSFLLNSGRFAASYDPCKYAPNANIRRVE